MRVIVSGGGTAGHVNPAIACALEIQARGHEVLYIGTPNGVESKLAPQAGLHFEGLPASGFDRSKPTTLLISSVKTLSSACKAWKRLGSDTWDVVLGFGGYVSLPVGLAASWRHIPLVIHEQNSVPGLTNKVLAPRAQAIALTYEMSMGYFKDSASLPMHVTGNPVRGSVLAGDRARGRAAFGVPDDALLLLVTGGSLGAQHLNNAIVALKDALLDIDNLYIVQSTGQAKYEEVRDGLGERDETRWQIYPYLHEMGDALCACDMILSRAGATSLAEITTVGIPSLLVPFPYATDDHQSKNASDLAAAGACLLVADKDLDSPRFYDALLKLCTNASLRQTMAAASKSIGRPQATMSLVDLSLGVARPKVK